MKVMFKNSVYSLQDKDSKLTGAKNKNEAQIKTKKDIVQEAFKKIQEQANRCGFKSEEEKARYEAKINEKIRLGEKLSQNEMNYLQRTNPSLYTRIKRIQMQRELLEKRLNQCKSKKEVEEVYNQAIATIHKKDPDKALVIKAYDNVTKEFKSTSEYRSLPWEVKDKEHTKAYKSINVKC